MNALEKIMLLEGAKTVPELARKLDVPKATIDTWKSRGSIPQRVLRGWAIKYGKTVDWFLSPSQDMNEEKPTLEATARKVGVDLGVLTPEMLQGWKGLGIVERAKVIEYMATLAAEKHEKT